MKATWDGVCAACPDPIKAGQDVLLRGRDWIHARCAKGGDE